MNEIRAQNTNFVTKYLNYFRIRKRIFKIFRIRNRKYLNIFKILSNPKMNI